MYPVLILCSVAKGEKTKSTKFQLTLTRDGGSGPLVADPGLGLKIDRIQFQILHFFGQSSPLNFNKSNCIDMNFLTQIVSHSGGDWII